MSDPTHISTRKDDHLDLCATDQVQFRDRTTLLECVQLVHQCLPDLHVDDVDPSVEFLGKTLRYPIFVSGMTGGTERAAEVNHGLAKLAQRHGVGFGLGSQRAMKRDPSVTHTYAVRDSAPDVLLLGNIGVVQARDYSTEEVQSLVNAVGADGLCVHMNVPMELVQPGGDRDFRGGLQTFERLANQLTVPVVAKETGQGISAQAAAKLKSVGVHCVDVSGAGGTSWVGVETLRAKGEARDLGDLLWDWGIPTAASVAYSSGEGMATIATGGIRTGLDIARAISLGASAGGVARSLYQAFVSGGEAAADLMLTKLENELKAVMLMCGARTVEDLQGAPKVIRGELREWVRVTT